ncbi:CBS domain-containing protein [Leptolyngbya cf. ectocarpi LEGE 11479]|uniref:CBS domain-containing protein n=1 Tax=Leptolyngbya cf. ectocarpi LEGE 11479 TaxID=1828722 RepID=A0A928ZTU0_LEPEC|nr:CBS domain-containing protein [Leptolyngbya ectocarpi]MBE9067229.1 CBS domain-containing protein [Leptolyngbya cf. ectocarpi LEGE 11479]
MDQTYLVKDLMTLNPVTVKPLDLVETVLKRLEENHVSGLPVVNDDNKVVGIISEADLLFKERPIQLPLYLNFLGTLVYLDPPGRFQQQLKKSLGILVQDVMTSHAITITPKTPIAKAANLMIGKRVNRLPVVDNQKQLVGIITREDLLKALREDSFQTADVA